MPMFNGFQKSKFSKIGEKLQKFILGENDEELIARVKNYTNHANYAADIWGDSSSMQTLGLLREVPSMLRDSIILSCLAAIMETAFQLNDKGKAIWPISPYETIKKELEIFHEQVSMSQQSITTGFNLLLWGNLPFKHYFDANGKFSNFSPIPDFTKVIPIIVSGKTLGFMVGNQFCFPYEYSYGQLEFYKNLGGIYKNNLVQFSGSSGETDIFGQDFQNEFVVAPSYLSTAARPWKNINIIEDALLLNRMDQSNYYRIFSVLVGGSVTSKSAIRTLNYYRNLFKKVRRVSYNASGMAASGAGNEFEIVLPKTDKQGLDIQDIGGNVDVKCFRYNTKVKLLDGSDVPIGYMVENKEQFLGKGVFVCASDGAVSVAPIIDLFSQRKNTTFVRVTLDNGEFFDVTPDHNCQLRSGSLMEAQHLKKGDSLMPFYWHKHSKDYTKSVNGDYSWVMDPKTHKNVYVHRMVGTYLKGCCLSRDDHVHHKNMDHYNTDFSNLEVLPSKEHYKKHKTYLNLVLLRRSLIRETRKRNGTNKCYLKDIKGHIIHMLEARRKKYSEMGLPPSVIAYHKNRREKQQKHIHVLKCACCGESFTRLLLKRELRGLSLEEYLSKPSFCSKSCHIRYMHTLRQGGDISKLESNPLVFVGVLEFKCVICGRPFKVEINDKMPQSDLNSYLSQPHVCSFSCRAKNNHPVKWSQEVDLTCAKCGKNFNRVLDKYNLSFDDSKAVEEYLSKPRCCSRSCASSLPKKPYRSASVLNHKVVSVVPLDVVEDSYDLTVGGENHCFALSSGVFVHNCLKDLETQYNKLFAALKVQPSQIGFGEEQANAIGDTNGQSYDRRLARTCKMLIYSVQKVIKNFDLLYLRSRGYDVTLDDWSYGTVSLSILEDQDRAATLKSSIENLKAIAEVINTLQLPDYNKSYLIESILGQSLSAVNVDVKEMLKIPEGQEQSAEGAGGGSGNPPLLASKQPGKIDYKSVYLTSMLDTMASVKLVSSDFIESARKALTDDKTRSNLKLVSSGKQIVHASVLDDGNAYLYPEDSLVDLSGMVNFINGNSAQIISDLDKAKSKKYEDMVTIDFNTTVLVPSDLKMTLGDYNTAGIRALGTCYVNSRGEVIIPDKNDLATFLSMKRSGLLSCLVSRLYQVP